MLDAVRRRGHDGDIRPAQHHQPGGKRGALPPRQKQHRHQPPHLHPHEQTGESTALFYAEYVTLVKAKDNVTLQHLYLHSKKDK